MNEIKFFRKRSGRVVKFNKDKISSAILRALVDALQKTNNVVDIDAPNVLADKVCAELNNPESPFFVREDSIGSRIPKLECVQDAVEYVIGQGYPEIGGYTDSFAKLVYTLYSDYRKMRDEARKKVRVIGKKSEKVDVTDKGMLLQEDGEKTFNGWDRNHLENDLILILKDEDKAADIAKRVEKAILKSGLQEVTSNLVTELANNELTSDGLQVRLNQGSGYLVE